MKADFLSVGCDRRRQFGRGFSLVELLVVIAILAVMGSLLLPAIGKGKGAARRILCASHLGQWGLAQHLYSADNGELIPRESYIDHEVSLNLWAQVQNVQAEDVWYNALASHAGVPGAAYYAPMDNRDRFYSGSRLFHCPEARFAPGLSRDPVAYFSLAMNSKLIMSPYRSAKLSAIKQPSQTVLFLDNRFKGEPKVDPFQTDFELGQPSAYANRFSIRHGGRGQMVFGDQHVEALAGPLVVTNGMAIFPQTSVIWTLDKQIDPNFYY